MKAEWQKRLHHGVSCWAVEIEDVDGFVFIHEVFPTRSEARESARDFRKWGIRTNMDLRCVSVVKSKVYLLRFRGGVKQ